MHSFRREENRETCARKKLLPAGFQDIHPLKKIFLKGSADRRLNPVCYDGFVTVRLYSGNGDNKRLVHTDKSGFGQQLQHIFKGHCRHVGFACSNDLDVVVESFDNTEYRSGATPHGIGFYQLRGA